MKKVIVPFLTSLLISTSVFAISRQSPDLDTFLKNFNDNPKEVMNQLPPKGGNLDYVDYTFGMKPLSRPEINAIIDAKDAERKNKCTIIKGETVCLDTPEGKASIAANDRPENLVDSAMEICSRYGKVTNQCLAKYKFIKNIKEMETRGLTSAKLDVTPWSDDYWPIAAGILAKRYQISPTPEDEIEWDVLKSDFDSNPASNFIANLTVGSLSPSEKYDLLVGDKNFTLTKSMWREGRGYFERNGEVERWMGICHGWAAAAYMYPRPEKMIVVKNADGLEIPFYPSDIKGLGSLNFAKKRYPTRFIGGRCNTKEPRENENGRVEDQNCFDTNPGAWHQAVVNQLGISKRSFIIDATYDYEVWNQPVFSYSYKYFNPEKYKYTEDFNASLIKIEDFKSDKFSSFRSKNTAYVIGIEMFVEYVAETSPSAREYDNSQWDLISDVTYRYDLELDKNLNIIGGEWYLNTHPDFLWTLAETTVVENMYDRYLKQVNGTKWARQKGPNQLITAIAKRASAGGTPLNAVVDKLFKWASEL